METKELNLNKPLNEVFFEPPLEKWYGYFKEIASQKMQNIQNFSLRDKIRGTVFELASDYTYSVLNEESAKARSYDPSMPLVVVGHQPIVFHSGIQRKNATLGDLVKSGAIQGLEVILDIDHGEEITLNYPRGEKSDEIKIQKQPITEVEGVYLSQKILSQKLLTEAFTKIDSEISGQFRTQWEKGRQELLPLAGCSAVVAMTKFRRKMDPMSSFYPAIPFSQLLKIKEIATFLYSVLNQASLFTEEYNKLLDQYRVEHKIKNHAQPLPNLQHKDDKRELPFWLIDSDMKQRFSLWFNPDGYWFYQGEEWRRVASDQFSFDLGAREYTIVPKALLITAVLRMLISDVFIHGRGGARYDQILDGLIRNFWREEPAPYVMTSETRLIDPDRARKSLQTTELKNSGRELQYRLDSRLKEGKICPPFKEELELLNLERMNLLELRKQLLEQKASLAEITQKIKSTDKRIQEAIARFLDSIPETSQDTKEALFFREFPAFFFENDL